MRHLFTAALGVVLLSALGCSIHHTAGFCDCDDSSTVGCCYSHGTPVHSAAGSPAAAETIKVMPMETPKKLPMGEGAKPDK